MSVPEARTAARCRVGVLSHETIANITDQISEEVLVWQQRPLDALYPVIYLDAIVVKVRDGAHVFNKAAHIRSTGVRPAYAGVDPAQDETVWPVAGPPRVCGGRPRGMPASIGTAESAPRVRGWTHRALVVVLLPLVPPQLSPR